MSLREKFLPLSIAATITVAISIFHVPMVLHVHARSAVVQIRVVTVTRALLVAIKSVRSFYRCSMQQTEVVPRFMRLCLSRKFRVKERSLWSSTYHVPSPRHSNISLRTSCYC